MNKEEENILIGQLQRKQVTVKVIIFTIED